jgi:hypothetical protein
MSCYRDRFAFFFYFYLLQKCCTLLKFLKGEEGVVISCEEMLRVAEISERRRACRNLWRGEPVKKLILVYVVYLECHLYVTEISGSKERSFLPGKIWAMT